MALRTVEDVAPLHDHDAALRTRLLNVFKLARDSELLDLRYALQAALALPDEEMRREVGRLTGPGDGVYDHDEYFGFAAARRSTNTPELKQIADSAAKLIAELNNLRGRLRNALAKRCSVRTLRDMVRLLNGELVVVPWALYGILQVPEYPPEPPPYSSRWPK